eukprot:scaffold18557_cov25-Cyclotella_meneghiniana.AAC.4
MESKSSSCLGSIPTIDFTPFTKNEGVVIGASTPTLGQLAVANQINDACRSHGFVFLTNFGLSDQERQGAFHASKELFGLDNDHKMNELHRLSTNDNTGYAPFLSETLNRTRPPDLKEAFNVNYNPNNNLSGCPESFKTYSDLLLKKLKKAAIHYAMACALALGLPLDFFSKALIDMDLCTIRYLHYPPCSFDDSSSSGLEKPIRVGEHTDWGLFTFLFWGETSGSQGFQIKQVEGGEVGGAAGQEQGGWQDLLINDGTSGVIVNTGALMARWTNDVWKATAHRVIVPNESVAKRDRYSIAFFIDPDSKTVIDTPSELLKDGETTSKYYPVSSLEFIMAKLREAQSVKTT